MAGLLLDEVTADGNSTAETTGGGRYTLAAWGTFGGGSVALQWSPNNTNFFNLASLSSEGASTVEVPPGYIRAALSSSTGATISAFLSKHTN